MTTLPTGLDRAASPATDVLAVELYEDEGGRMVVVDLQRTRPGATAPLPPLRLGGVRLRVRELSPERAGELLATGRVVVDGNDALNVLLAFGAG